MEKIPKIAKKAQAAIFLILAALILFGAIYYFSIERGVTKKPQKVPVEFEPVVVFVDECIKQAVEDGLGRIGLTGGYIDYPQRIANNPRSHLPTPNPSIIIPYWWYDGKNAMPSEEFIRLELEKFIKPNIVTCLNNFHDLESQFYIKPLSQLQAGVSFNEEDVSVDVEYELEATSKLKDRRIAIRDFFYRSDTRFKKVYELAKAIMERENNGFFIEEKTIDLIALASGNRNVEKSIPLTDTIFFDCTSRKWRIPDIKKRLQELLVTNLPYVKVVGTDINLKTYVPNPCTQREYRGHFLCQDGNTYDNTYESSYFKSHYLWDIGDTGQKYANMEVAFSYNAPLELDVRPREGNLLKSNLQKGTDVLKFLCINTWHFTYDISYPVMVTIFDKQTNKNKPYLFNFPFKVLIKGNQPNRETTGNVLFEGTQESNDDFCNDEFYKSREITTIYTQDSDYNAIDNVAMEFTCGKINCEIGQTEFNDQLSSASISKRFPACTNGIINAIKDGHKDSSMFIQTDNVPGTYNIMLNATKDFGKCNLDNTQCTSYRVLKTRLRRPLSAGVESITAKLREDNKDRYWIGDEFRDIADLENERALITIQDTKSEHESFGSYPAEAGALNIDSDRVEQNTPISLLRDFDADYKVIIYLSDKDNERVKGGYEGNWVVSKQDVKSNDNIVFYVIEFEPNSASEEEKEEEMSVFLSNLEFFSKKLNEKLESPKFQ